MRRVHQFTLHIGGKPDGSYELNRTMIPYRSLAICLMRFARFEVALMTSVQDRTENRTVRKDSVPSYL